MTNSAKIDGSKQVAHLFDDGYTGTLDPFALFEVWLAEAVEKEINDPNAMSVASVDSNGMPDVRMLLLNARDERGFVCFTNFNSAKGQQLQENSVGAMLFHWKSVRRQVRIRGAMEQISDAEADAYFATRPRQSQIGAHASNQSHPLQSRDALLQTVAQVEQSFGDAQIPRPAHWSGFRLKPIQIEFWQDGAFRLHDRVVFTRNSDTDSTWSRTRLNP